MSGVAVVGLGRELRGDDAIGLAAVRRWVQQNPATASEPRVRVVELTSAGPDLLAVLGGAAAAVIVDAVRGAGLPGSVHLLDPDDLAAFGAGSGSAHGWGVSETLALADVLEPGSIPSQVLVVGIEVHDLTVGAELSRAAARALDPAVELIERLVQAALVSTAEPIIA